ncbi:MAG: hypothetical protein ACTSXH_08670 [Promethearchaeota archaeon]
METKSNSNSTTICQSTLNPAKWKGRTIEIDDAGTGDLVGNAFIGYRDTSTEKIIFKSVPVELYNEENRGQDRSKEHILKITLEALEELNYSKENNRILLCRGNCFDRVREYFEEKEIYYEPAIIEGELQEAVENKFIQHLRKLGVKSKNLTTESGAKRYFVLFNWVCRDFPNREKYVKIGFPSWKKKWRKIAMERYEKYQQTRKNNKIKQIQERANIILKNFPK